MSSQHAIFSNRLSDFCALASKAVLRLPGVETRKNPMMLHDDAEAPVDAARVDHSPIANNRAMVNSMTVREYAVHCLVTMPVRNPRISVRTPCKLPTGL